MCENQNERWMRIHNLKLCKCGIQIPINQDTCYICWKWAGLDKSHRQYIRTRGRVLSYEALQERGRFINDGDATDDEIDINDNWLDFHIKQKF